MSGETAQGVRASLVNINERISVSTTMQCVHGALMKRQVAGNVITHQTVNSKPCLDWVLSLGLLSMGKKSARLLGLCSYLWGPSLSWTTSLDFSCPEAYSLLPLLMLHRHKRFHLQSPAEVRLWEQPCSYLQGARCAVSSPAPCNHQL